MGADLLVMMLGVAAGAVSGLFGVGGGILFVPTLAFVVGMSELHAQATSLLAIIPVAVFGTWRERATGRVDWTDIAVIGLAAIATAVLGSLLADVAPQRVLRVGFAVILVWTALRIMHGVRRRASRASAIDPSHGGD
jgi:uncharacterized membrane protein YfcA